MSKTDKEPHIKFNNLLEEFIDKTINLYKSAPALKRYRIKFIFLKQAHPKMPAYLFMSGSLDYKEKIIARDEQFFLSNQQIKDKSEMYGNFTKDFGISEYWNEMSDSTKTAIWDYIQSLFVLGNIIIEQNKEAFNKIYGMYAKDYKAEFKNENFSDNFLQKINSM